MSKPFSYGLFGVFVLAFCANWVAQKNGIHVPLVHAYMDDFICIPVILFPLLFVFRRWIYPSGRFVFPVGYIVTTWVLLSFMFEVYLPQKNAANTTDPLDMLFYALGGLVFYAMQKPFSVSSPVVLGKI